MDREAEGVPRLRIALIGAGRRGAGAHLPVIDKLADVYELVAICDRDEANVARLAAERGVPAYTSVRDLVSRERLDVADVVVPSDAHHAITLFLMKHGVNVLVETPIAPTLALADMMIEGAKRHDVKLEVAENYYRAPIERLIATVVEAGLIGEVSRVYRLFHEGGFHGMSSMRMHARGNPVSIVGVSHTSPIVPITDRMERRHAEERWTMGIVDFDNGVLGIQIYSNVTHAGSLGRGQLRIWQIDGTSGSIVDEVVHVVPSADLHDGARSRPVQPERAVRTEDGVDILEAIRLPGTDIAWESPFARYSLTERQVAIADELLSIARAVCEDLEPEYGPARARLDQEMNIAMLESATRDRQPIHFPLSAPTTYEQAIHASFAEKYGHDAEDVESLIDVFFPRV